MPAEVRPFRILVLDDNRDAAIVLVMLLIRHGYESIAIHSGADAIDAAERFRPDCLISDIAMPVVDGYEVARRFPSHEVHGRVSLIALSALAETDETLKAGFDFHLTKPVSSASLLSLLDQISGRVLERLDGSNQP
jgi:CheY-like chemotaxis protein